MLYRQNVARVHRHLCALVGPGAEADDALQQTFLEAFRNIHRFEGRSRVSTWLHGIAVRVALNVLRSRRRRARAMTAFSAESRGREPVSRLERDVAAKEQARRLQKYLDRVSAKKQLAFRLYYIEQLPLREVAELTGTSTDTAWARIKRTRAHIIKAIERENRAVLNRLEGRT